MVKISVIIPVYNVEKYLKECLDSVINQDIDSFEIICVNDGSKDTSQIIIEKYQKKYSLIKLIIQENQGLSVARNNGLRKAAGEYVLFVDSDDFIEPNVLNDLYEISNNNQLDILDFLAFSVNNKIKKPWLKEYLRSENVRQGRDYFKDYINNCKKQPFVPAWMHLFRKDFLINNELLFIPGRFYEDSPFTARSYLKARRVMFIERYVYNYRFSIDSITKGIVKQKNIEDYSFIIQEIVKISKEYNIKIPMDAYLIGLKHLIGDSFLNENWSENMKSLNSMIFKTNSFYLVRKRNKLIYNLSSLNHYFFILYSISYCWIKNKLKPIIEFTMRDKQINS